MMRFTGFSLSNMKYCFVIVMFLGIFLSCDSSFNKTLIRDEAKKNLIDIGSQIQRKNVGDSLGRVFNEIEKKYGFQFVERSKIKLKLTQNDCCLLFDRIREADRTLDLGDPFLIYILNNEQKSKIKLLLLFSNLQVDYMVVSSEELETLLKIDSPVDALRWYQNFGVEGKNKVSSTVSETGQ